MLLVPIASVSTNTAAQMKKVVSEIFVSFLCYIFRVPAMGSNNHPLMCFYVLCENNNKIIYFG